MNFTHDLNSTLNSGNVLQCKVAQASYVKHIFVQLLCGNIFCEKIFFEAYLICFEQYICLENCLVSHILRNINYIVFWNIPLSKSNPNVWLQEKYFAILDKYI